MTAGGPVPQSFFARDALPVAHDLVGMVLARDGVAVRITEVEAYCWPDDTASHCRHGCTARNAAMWGPPGRAYVYQCYGIHQMLNLVTNREGEGAAVLIRACEPVSGLPEIRARRGGKRGPVLLTGPGKVGAALGLDTSWSHHPLYEPGGLELRTGERPAQVLVGPRVGIGYADPAHVAAPWRVAAGDTAWVSHRRTLSPAQGV